LAKLFTHVNEASRFEGMVTITVLSNDRLIDVSMLLNQLKEVRDLQQIPGLEIQLILMYQKNVGIWLEEMKQLKIFDYIVDNEATWEIYGVSTTTEFPAEGTDSLWLTVEGLSASHLSESLRE
jgi:hypothetical protein